MESNPDLDKWLKEVAPESKEKIDASAVFVPLVTDSYLNDPLCALQLGYAILMDKPIFLIVDLYCRLPSNLVRAARSIERIDAKNQKDMERAVQAIGKLIQTLPKPEKPLMKEKPNAKKNNRQRRNPPQSP